MDNCMEATAYPRTEIHGTASLMYFSSMPAYNDSPSDPLPAQRLHVVNYQNNMSPTLNCRSSCLSCLNFT